MSCCRTCKWWGSEHEHPEEMGKDWHYCRMTERVDGYKATHPESLAIATDAENFHAILKTQADFGCNQYAMAEPSGAPTPDDNSPEPCAWCGTFNYKTYHDYLGKRVCQPCYERWMGLSQKL